MRPSRGPLWNLATAFAGLEGRDTDLERIADIASSFSARSATLASVVASIDSVKGKSLCVLVDQFEELFRYEKGTSRDDAELFIDLIRRAARDDPGAASAGVDLHVIVTMRSEFLGECARFAGFAETVNRTQYLVPRPDDDGLLRAVGKPAQMYGAVFEESLAERLIASVRGREDELPLLQHGLMLIWEDGQQRARAGEQVKLDGAIVDDAEGLVELLSRHADKIIASVTPEARRALVGAVFRALTSVNSEGAAIRRPLAFKALCAEAGAGADDLRPILDAFRASGVSFLSPYAPKPIEDKTLIDISHEALIRCWRKIDDKPDGWLQQEIRDGLAWRALLYQAGTFAKDKTSFLPEAATEAHGAWIRERNEAWAARYDGGWSEIGDFVKVSEKHWQDERRDREAKQLDELGKAQRLAEAERKAKEAAEKAASEAAARTAAETEARAAAEQRTLAEQQARDVAEKGAREQEARATAEAEARAAAEQSLAEANQAEKRWLTAIVLGGVTVTSFVLVTEIIRIWIWEALLAEITTMTLTIVVLKKDQYSSGFYNKHFPSSMNQCPRPRSTGVDIDCSSFCNNSEMEIYTFGAAWLFDGDYNGISYWIVYI
jgi:hypothetical protein